jgi:mannitol-1-phosphate/altronate dehydrogenase
VLALATPEGDAGLPPFTVLTCDNLPDNGRLVRGVRFSIFARAARFGRSPPGSTG